MSDGNLSRVGKYVDAQSGLKDHGGTYDLFDGFNIARNGDGFEDRTYYNMTTSMTPFYTRAIASDSYMGNTADYDGPYDVHEMFFNQTAGNYRIYIVHKATTTTTFYNDTPIGGIQILDIEGTPLHTVQPFTTTFQTLPYESQSIYAPGYYANAVGSSFVSCPNNGAADQFNVRSSTSSSYTGAEGGIDLTQYGGGTGENRPLPVGEGTMAQYDTINYLYREASGSLRNYYSVARTTNTYSIPAQGSIRIAFANTTINSQISSMDQNNTLFLGMY